MGGGLTDDLAGRFSFYVDDHGGYEKNLFTGSNVNNANQYGGRGRLRWTPDAGTTVDLTAYYAYDSTDGTIPAQVDPFGLGGIATPGFLTAAAAAVPGHPFVSLGNFQVNEGDDPLDVTTSWGVSVNASRTLPFGATLSNLLAYSSLDDHEFENDSAGLAPGGRSSAAARADRDYERRAAPHLFGQAPHRLCRRTLPVPRAAQLRQ